MRLYTFFLLHTIYINLYITVFWLEAGCWMHFFLWILFLESVAKAGIVCRQKEIWCQPQWYGVGIARWSTWASERIPDTSGYHKLGSFRVPLFSFPFRPSHFLFSNRLLRSRTHVAQLACNSIHEKRVAHCRSSWLRLSVWSDEHLSKCVCYLTHYPTTPKTCRQTARPWQSSRPVNFHTARPSHPVSSSTPWAVLHSALEKFFDFLLQVFFSGHPQKQNFWRSRRFKSYRCEEWIFKEQRHYISMSLITYSL